MKFKRPVSLLLALLLSGSLIVTPGTAAASASGQEDTETAVALPAAVSAVDMVSGNEITQEVLAAVTGASEGQEGAVSERDAFIADVYALETNAGTVYTGKPYGLNREIEALRDRYERLSEGDKLSMEVAEAYEALNSVTVGVGLETGIVRFINAALSLIERIDNGLSIETEDCQELAAMVSERYEALTEEQMEDPEVVDAWNRLCGLLGQGSQNIASTDYSVALEWVTAGTDSGGIRTFDGTVSNSLSLQAKLNITVNGTVDARSISIRVPNTLSTGRIAAKNAKLSQSLSSYSGVSITKSSSYVTITNTSTSGIHVSIPLVYSFETFATVSNKTFDLYVDVSDGTQTVRKTLQWKLRTTYNIGNIRCYSPGIISMGGLYNSDKHLASYRGDVAACFGLSADDFDFEHYVYDVLVLASDASGNQPYNLDITITPGASTAVSGRYYGWEGEIVSARVTNSMNKNGLLKTGTSQKTIGGHVYNSYTYRYKSMRVDSSYVYNNDVLYRGEYFHFLIRYPKDRRIVYNNSTDTFVAGSTNIRLYSDWSAVSTGVDDGTSFSFSKKNEVLYTGLYEITSYTGSIYTILGKSGSARMVYNNTNMNTESLTMNSIPMGITTLNISSSLLLPVEWYDFTVINTARPGYKIGQNNKTYRVECLIDSVMANDLRNTVMKLDDSNIRIRKCTIQLMDSFESTADLVNTGYNDGVEINSVSMPLPDAWKDRVVSVYGNVVGGGYDDWVLLKSIPYEDVWGDVARNWGYGTGKKYNLDSLLENNRVSRLKFVADSENLFQLSVNYQVEISILDNSFRSFMNTVKSKNDAYVDFIGYPGMVAYSDGNTPDLVCSRSSVAGVTGTPFRTWEASHPYAGYSSSKFPYRVRSAFRLGQSPFAKDMFAVRGLFGAGNSTIGSYSNTAINSYRLQTSGKNISAVGYSLFSCLLHSSADTKVVDVRENLGKYVKGFDASYMRFYVLLPENLTYQSNSSHRFAYIPYPSKFNQVYGGFNYTLPLESNTLDSLQASFSSKLNGNNVTTGNKGFNIQGLGGLSSADVYNDPDVLVIGGREVLVFDTSKYPNSAYNVRGMSAGGFYSASGLIMPSGISWYGDFLGFSVVPKDGKPLPSGLYDVKIACQYMDENGNPIDLSDIMGTSYSSLEEAFPGTNWGALNEETRCNSSILATSDQFVNLDSSMATTVSTRVNGGSEYELAAAGDSYVYDLTYTCATGTSKNVVLFDSVENYSRSNGSSAWSGTLQSIDLNGNTCSVWVKTTGIDINDYQTRKVNASLLSSLGWTRVTNVSTYNWSKVKAIAFDFGTRVFDASDINKASATVHLHMKAPDEIKGALDSDSNYTAWNECGFYDSHSANGAGFAISNAAKVYLHEEAWWAMLPVTGGGGVGTYLATGTVLLSAGVLLFWLRKWQKSRT